jgi:hypothetical protein
MKVSAFIAITFLFFGAVLAPAQEEPASNLSFVILRDYNGKPVQNASVILHPVGKSGKQARGGYQLKTDADGKTNFDGVPYGKLRVQVLAHGFQTYGEDYNIEQPTTAITIKLKRPRGQYSIYDSQSGDKKEDEKKKEDKNPQNNR